MSKLKDYILGFIGCILAIAWIGWFLYETIKVLPELLMTIGFITVVVLLIAWLEYKKKS